VDQRTEKRLNATWKTLTLIGAIAAAGFAAATFLSKYQTQDDARREHTEIRSATTTGLAAVEHDVEANEGELRQLKILNVRMAAQQENQSDRMEQLIELQRPARSRRARAAQEQRVDELEQRIQRRDAVLDRAGGGEDDPLVQLEGL